MYIKNNTLFRNIGYLRIRTLLMIILFMVKVVQMIMNCYLVDCTVVAQYLPINISNVLLTLYDP